MGSYRNREVGEYRLGSETNPIYMIDNSYSRSKPFMSDCMLVIRNLLLLAVPLISLPACSDLSNPTLPSGMQSPDTYHSREGGLMLAESALRTFREAWRMAVLNGGLLSDEITSTNGSSTTGSSVLDRRSIQEFSNEPFEQSASEQYSVQSYVLFHQLRGQARMARSVIEEYAPTLSPGVRARLYAFEAYAEVWLADLYCSGIPLSTLDFKGDFTYKIPSTTEEVYLHAASLFDSAISLTSDSTHVTTLARVGKGRALLAIGHYDEAEAAIEDVSIEDFYNLKISFRDVSRVESNIVTNTFFSYGTVSDIEGSNGYPYISSRDPRTAVVLLPIIVGSSATVFFPEKFVEPNDSNWFHIVSGVDAELIRAEAAMQRSDWHEWLSILNRLRTTATFNSIDTLYSDATNSTILRIDTMWQAGTAGVHGLSPLTDPGNETLRIKLLFDERAAWLFAMGNRQGDLRRLVRVYGWDKELVYPTGVYHGSDEYGTYGTEITIPIPTIERRNKFFNGCIHRD